MFRVTSHAHQSSDPRRRRPAWPQVQKRVALSEVVGLRHGASSESFFRQSGTKEDQDWLCFSVVFKGRGTLDFAATNADSLLDWYLALASKVRHSTEALLDEAALRARIEGMF